MDIQLEPMNLLITQTINHIMKVYLRLKLSFFLFYLFVSCASWRSGISLNGNYETGIMNAIIDFSNTTALVKYDSTFLVEFKNIDSKLLGVSLCGTVGKLVVTDDGKSSRIPTRYLEYHGKLFYWYDEKYSLDNNIINKLSEYNLIDSVETVAQAKFVIDDAKQCMDYYFCKKNLSKYKKVKNNKALGYYKFPRLNCKD